MKTINRSRLACAVLFAFFAVGCTGVVFKQPVGIPNAEAAAQLKGTWLVHDEIVVFVNGGTDGRLVLGVVDDSKSDLKLNKLKATATVLDEKDEAFLLNIERESEREKEKDVPKAVEVTVLLIKIDQKTLLAWKVDEDMIKAAIEKKELPGSVMKSHHSDDIRIDAGKEAVDAYFKSHGRSLFKMDAPMVAKRIGEEKSKESK